jgi:hypothetical protein
MCEYFKLKIENWNLYVKLLEFENFENLKTKNWNLYVKLLEFEILKTEN